MIALSQMSRSDPMGGSGRSAPLHRFGVVSESFVAKIVPI
jgi:hypothetical protein